MPHRSIHLVDPDELHEHFRALRREFDVPGDFPRDVLAEAEEAASLASRPHPYDDARDIPFVTIDPPGSTDLDQAVHLARDGAGYLVDYAIADVATFVRPGGAVDGEAQQRGLTFYGPDGRVPLHPTVLSEGAASLLPGVDRPACLWRLRLDGDGRLRAAHVRRAVVRSRAKLAYVQVQADLDTGRAGAMLGLLAEIGPLRAERERARGGVSMPIPEQDVVRTPAGYALEYRGTLPVEAWNAQISLATGIAAGGIMREAGIGILRTLDPPEARDVERLRRVAAALSIRWADDEPYGDLIGRLDPARPADAALLDEATSLFRNVGYGVFGVSGDGEESAEAAAAMPHAAIASEYAHVTAPLRRLVDRFGLEICLAHCAGEPLPGWVRTALPGLPRLMARAAQKAGRYERASIETVEAAVLAGREGEVFEGSVVEVHAAGDDGEPRRGEVVLADLAVRAVVTGADLPLGERIRVRLVAASPATRDVHFERVP